MQDINSLIRKCSNYDIPWLEEAFLTGFDETRIFVGDDVLYSGFPNGMKDSRNGLALMRKGSIASIPTMDCNGKGLIAIDGTVLPGNSGGPVFVAYDEAYWLLGVMHAASTVADDYGFVIKHQYVRELIGDALERSADGLGPVNTKQGSQSCARPFICCHFGTFQNSQTR